MPKQKTKIDWKTVAVAGLATIAVAMSASSLVAVTRQEKTVDIGWTNYQVAGVTEAGKIDTSIKETITSDLINAKGLTVDFDEDANLSIVVHYYDEDKQYLSEAMSSAYTDDFDATVPDGAEYARLVITPKSDEDGEISYAEMLKYVGQFTATVDK